MYEQHMPKPIVIDRSQPVTTRRALEVVLSRVGMDKYTATVLLSALLSECEKETPPRDAEDLDGLISVLKHIEDLASDVDKKFTKDQLLGRINTIRMTAIRNAK